MSLRRRAKSRMDSPKLLQHFLDLTGIPNVMSLYFSMTLFNVSFMTSSMFHLALLEPPRWSRLFLSSILDIIALVLVAASLAVCYLRLVRPRTILFLGSVVCAAAFHVAWTENDTALFTDVVVIVTLSSSYLESVVLLSWSNYLREENIFKEAPQSFYRTPVLKPFICAFGALLGQVFSSSTSISEDVHLIVVDGFVVLACLSNIFAIVIFTGGWYVRYELDMEGTEATDWNVCSNLLIFVPLVSPAPPLFHATPRGGPHVWMWVSYIGLYVFYRSFDEPALTHILGVSSLLDSTTACICLFIAVSNVGLRYIGLPVSHRLIWEASVFSKLSLAVFLVLSATGGLFWMAELLAAPLLLSNIAFILTLTWASRHAFDEMFALDCVARVIARLWIDGLVFTAGLQTPFVLLVATSVPLAIATLALGRM